LLREREGEKPGANFGKGCERGVELRGYPIGVARKGKKKKGRFPPPVNRSQEKEGNINSREKKGEGEREKKHFARITKTLLRGKKGVEPAVGKEKESFSIGGRRRKTSKKQLGGKLPLFQGGEKGRIEEGRGGKGRRGEKGDSFLERGKKWFSPTSQNCPKKGKGEEGKALKRSGQKNTAPWKNLTPFLGGGRPRKKKTLPKKKKSRWGRKGRVSGWKGYQEQRGKKGEGGEKALPFGSPRLKGKSRGGKKKMLGACSLGGERNKGKVTSRLFGQKSVF